MASSRARACAPCRVIANAIREERAITPAAEWLVDNFHIVDAVVRIGGRLVPEAALVVGIATGGAAPVFAQALRGRIETILPQGFARWMRTARDWRASVSAICDAIAEVNHLRPSMT